MAVVFGLVWRLWPVFVEVVRLLVERVLASLAERLGMGGPPARIDNGPLR